MVEISYVFESLIIGVFCVAVYAWIIYFMPIEKYLKKSGIFTKIVILAFVLFLFGFEKHVIEFYGFVWAGYCKTREKCYTPTLSTTTMSIQLAKDYFTYAKNVYVDAFWEGVLFTCIGLPFALTINNGYVVAFLTGVLSHILAEWLGFNADICKTNCIQDSSKE